MTFWIKVLVRQCHPGVGVVLGPHSAHYSLKCPPNKCSYSTGLLAVVYGERDIRQYLSSTEPSISVFSFKVMKICRLRH